MPERFSKESQTVSAINYREFTTAISNSPRQVLLREEETVESSTSSSAFPDKYPGLTVLGEIFIMNNK